MVGCGTSGEGTFCLSPIKIMRNRGDIMPRGTREKSDFVVYDKSCTSY
ncbi:hypothetical protein [Anaerosalibacter sp. Marseille-P3206]|nr:hypothetical protein [Anaerosalibacter sp. Marseille-P3206]